MQDPRGNPRTGCGRGREVRDEVDEGTGQQENHEFQVKHADLRSFQQKCQITDLELLDEEGRGWRQKLVNVLCH